MIVLQVLPVSVLDARLYTRKIFGNQTAGYYSRYDQGDTLTLYMSCSITGSAAHTEVRAVPTKVTVALGAGTIGLAAQTGKTLTTAECEGEVWRDYCREKPK